VTDSQARGSSVTQNLVSGFGLLTFYKGTLFFYGYNVYRLRTIMDTRWSLEAGWLEQGLKR